VSTEPSTFDGNWHVLLAGLPSFGTQMALAPGIMLYPLNSPLSVFDLAAAGAAGFRGWAALEQFAPFCTGEIESMSIPDSLTRSLPTRMYLDN